MTEYTNPVSLALYGVYRGLFLEDESAHDGLQSAIDPRPASTRYPGRDAIRDPFNNTDRDLRLTLSSTCRWLDKNTLHDLLELCQQPGIQLDCMPPTPCHDTTSGTKLEIRGTWPHYTVHHRQAGTATVVSLDPALIQIATDLWEVPKWQAQHLAREIESHNALGNDYFVCNIASSNRHRSRNTWPHYAGVCQVDEAFRLAGAKARMYPSVPLHSHTEDGFTESLVTNVGRLRDLAAMSSAPFVRRAIEGVTSPTAGRVATECMWDLLTIRRLLHDYLIARDCLYRLSRREALHAVGRHHDTSSAGAGALENDLAQEVSYHALAALNVAYAISDNTASIVSRHLGHWTKNVSLSTLYGKKSLRWTKEPAARTLLDDIRRACDHEDVVRFARELRNKGVHGRGFPFGRVVARRPSSSGTSDTRMFAYLIDSSDCKNWTGAVESAQYVYSEAGHASTAIIAPVGLMDVVWSATTEFVNAALSRLPWPDNGWIKGVSRYEEDVYWRRLFRDGSQRVQWGLGDTCGVQPRTIA